MGARSNGCDHRPSPRHAAQFDPSHCLRGSSRRRPTSGISLSRSHQQLARAHRMTAPAHLYPLCENCGATICPPAAGVSCEHVCGASRAAPVLDGSTSRLDPSVVCAGPRKTRRPFLRSLSLTHSFRARALLTTNSASTPIGRHSSRVSSLFSMKQVFHGSGLQCANSVCGVSK